MALYTIRSGVNNHPERTVLQFTSDMVRRGGVISGFVTSEKAGGVGMSVDVSAGTRLARVFPKRQVVSLRRFPPPPNEPAICF